MPQQARDHGGGLDAAMARYGGVRSDWLDLSTGINPVPYPVGDLSDHSWTALPDSAAMDRLLSAARQFWQVPDEALILAAPGASPLIARLPHLDPGHGDVHIPRPTYNEHAAAFESAGTWRLTGAETTDTHVYVHPNNPDGRLWPLSDTGDRRLTIIDESFCDICPDQSHVARTRDDGIVVLKSFGKFWGLAGLRLGFAIGTPATLAPAHPPALSDLLGPWPVAGPALEIGARALQDHGWAAATRQRLAVDAARLDALMTGAGARVTGGTGLFRLYTVADAHGARDHLARHHIWSRIFPYAQDWLRLGMPAPNTWGQIEDAVRSETTGRFRAGHGTAGGAISAPPEPKSGA